jgi:hypothetical protein
MKESPTASVSVRSLRNVYHYSRWQLLVSYGIAALVTLFCVLAGIWCLHSNSAAYSNNFSTILRITRDSHLEEFIDDKDTSGIRPTPAHIGDIKVSLKRLDGVEHAAPRYAVLAERDGDDMIKMEDGDGSLYANSSSTSLQLLPEQASLSPLDAQRF